MVSNKDQRKCVVEQWIQQSENGRSTKCTKKLKTNKQTKNMRNDVGESREADNSRSKSKNLHEVTEICSG